MYFITDTQGSEPCVIAGFETEPLIFQDLDGEHIATLPCLDGHWTHAKILALDLTPFQEKLRQGADAFLGKQWIGSTEC